MNKTTEKRIKNGVEKIGDAFISTVKEDASDEEIVNRYADGVKEIYRAGRDKGFNDAYKIAGLTLIVAGFVYDLVDKKRYKK